MVVIVHAHTQDIVMKWIALGVIALSNAHARSCRYRRPSVSKKPALDWDHLEVVQWEVLVLEADPQNHQRDLDTST
jgi:hypothetical protein